MSKNLQSNVSVAKKVTCFFCNFAGLFLRHWNDHNENKALFTSRFLHTRYLNHFPTTRGEGASLIAQVISRWFGLVGWRVSARARWYFIDEFLGTDTSAVCTQRDVKRSVTRRDITRIYCGVQYPRPYWWTILAYVAYRCGPYIISKTSCRQSNTHTHTQRNWLSDHNGTPHDALLSTNLSFLTLTIVISYHIIPPVLG